MHQNCGACWLSASCWNSDPGLRDGSGHREMVVDSLMDAVAGARRTPGRLETGGVPSKPPATILLSVPSVFWDFGSLCQRRCGVISHALSRQPYFPSLSLRRLRLRVVAQASRTSHCDVSAPPDVEASRIASCRGRRVSFCRPHFSFSLLERLPRRHCQVVSPISKLTFEVASPPSCCRGNFHSFFMTLFTGRGRHHSSSCGGGAWGQCCHVGQLRLQPSWDISLWAHPRSSGLLCFVSPFVLQLWRKKERPFLVGDTMPDEFRHLARLKSSASRGRLKLRLGGVNNRATGFPRSDRGHHVPALTVTSGGRGVGSDVACSDKSSRGRERH